MSADDILLRVLHGGAELAEAAGPKFGNRGTLVATALALILRGAARALRRGDTIDEILARIEMPPRSVDVAAIEREIAEKRGGKS